MSPQVFPYSIITAVRKFNFNCSMPNQGILSKRIRIALKMRTDCFISGILEFVVSTLRIIQCFQEPTISRILFFHLNPMGPMSGHRIRIITGDGSLGRLLHIASFVLLGVITFMATPHNSQSKN